MFEINIMATTTLIKERQTCFQFKASFLPCTLLQITRYDLDSLEQELAVTVQRAPNFFMGSPVVIDLEKIKTLGSINFDKLKQILSNNGMLPIGVRSGSDEQIVAAQLVG